MKDLLRREIKQKRDSLSQGEIFEKSRTIMQKLFELKEFKKAETVMFYVSFGSEVHTHEMIEEALKTKKVLVPYISDCMKACKISSLFDLQVGKYGIPEPRHKKENKKIDLVIVPGLVFCKDGHRLGYGKGYYDIFLKKIKAQKIGLAFDFQIVKKLENCKHDVPVDKIVTEKKVY